MPLCVYVIIFSLNELNRQISNLKLTTISGNGFFLDQKSNYNAQGVFFLLNSHYLITYLQIAGKDNSNTIASPES